MTTIEVRNVTKFFKKKTALKPFSIKAEHGECVVICGGNGAGKSTLLHILAGISPPSEGTVFINKIDLQKDRNGYLTKIGYMPDEFHAQENLTVSEFLLFYGALRKVDPLRIIEIIELLGLEEKKNELVKHLSKGMRQRLLFGQAWVANPPILILDEPTNGLDPYWIDVFIELLNQIKKNGTIIIFSTHMMDVASEVADLVLFMKDGELLETLRNDHVNPKQFMVDLLHLYRKKDDKGA